MPRAAKQVSVPFVPIQDPAEVKSDPSLNRAFLLFDGLRKRNVGPDKAAYVVAQFFGSQAGSSSHPAPQAVVIQHGGAL